MKRIPITRAAAILIASLSSIASPRATASDSTEQWGVYDISLPGPRDDNPFVDVELGAPFKRGEQTIKVPGFHDGDGVYRVRFMPESTGTWTYQTTSNRPELTDRSGEVNVTPPSISRMSKIAWSSCLGNQEWCCASAVWATLRTIP